MVQVLRSLLERVEIWTSLWCLEVRAELVVNFEVGGVCLILRRWRLDVKNPGECLEMSLCLIKKHEQSTQSSS